MISGAAAAALAGCASKIPPKAVIKGAIGIVSAPNPHVFPLLLAMSLDPDLPVRLLPVAESRESDALFASGDADAMLAMTYIGAQKRMSGAIPDLRVHSISTWRGFFQVVPEGISNFDDLRGKTVIISGPVGSGKNGGGDIIFQAAARRQGIDPARDLHVEYMPSSQGIARVAAGLASGITLPSPGNTGVVMRSRMAQNPVTGAIMRLRSGEQRKSVPLTSGIDFQNIFNGFASFPGGQLPIGGLHVSERALAQSEKRIKLDRVAQAYAKAVARLMSDPASHVGIISSLFESHFANVGGGAPPGMLITRSVEAGDLIYRSDVSIDAVRSDLTAWLTELIGRDVDPAFLAA